MGRGDFLSKDHPELVAEKPQVEALIDRAYELNPDYEHGVIDQFWISYEPARQGAKGDPTARSKVHFDRAVELTNGQLASPFVSYAETVSVQKQSRAEFESLHVHAAGPSTGRRKMKRKILFLIYPLVFLGLQRSTRAQQIVLPAGTRLRCTFNEPNFSSATAEVGDPLLCHADAIQQFGRTVFPRGTYLAGHLEAYKDPGHFFGKGSLQVVFDCIGLPNTNLPVPGKIIAVRGYRVDREGKIRGHARRDALEWMLPPLWPWKVLMRPARGPRPALKGEVPVTLRLMEDVTVPEATASVSPTSRRTAAKSFTTPKSAPLGAFSLRYLPPTMPALRMGVAAPRDDS